MMDVYEDGYEGGRRGEEENECRLLQMTDIITILEGKIIMLHGSLRRPFVKLDSEVDEALAASESRVFLSRQRPIVESHHKVGDENP